MDNILALNRDLQEGSYRHGGYYAFKIADPKPRDIHKALVRDRLLHHAIYRQVYSFFDRTWIFDSYSCRNNKGTHKAMDRFLHFFRTVSKNNTKTCFVLKCDIRKFFASIDQEILLTILSRYTKDSRTLSLFGGIIRSFSSTAPGKGLPLGNLTSQLLVNVYMNIFDQFAKHKLKAKHYIRYADDFVILSADRSWLESIIPTIQGFLMDRLKLSLHPDKLFIKTFASGVDFLGWVHFPTHRVFRTSSKKRMIRNLNEDSKKERVESYRGLLTHGNGWKLSTEYLHER
jgi:RNA-directed DNA polymerase